MNKILWSIPTVVFFSLLIYMTVVATREQDKVYAKTPPESVVGQEIASSTAWKALSKDRQEAVADALTIAQAWDIPTSGLSSDELSLLDKALGRPEVPGYMTYRVANGSFLLVPLISEDEGREPPF